MRRKKRIIRYLILRTQIAPYQIKHTDYSGEDIE